MFQFELSTLIFQVVNFLVLLAILTRFFFRPLRQAMRRREEAIAARLQAAEERSQEADAVRAQLEADRQRVQAEAAAALAEARAAAVQEREHVLAQAREEIARLRDEAALRIREEERTAQERLGALVRETALAIAGSLVSQAAGPEVHRSLIARCFDAAHPFGDDQVALVRQAVAGANGTINVQTAYPLSTEQQEWLRRAVAAATERDAGTMAVEIQVDPSLIAGVRLVVGTVAIDASLRHTLETLGRDAASPAGA